MTPNIPAVVIPNAVDRQKFQREKLSREERLQTRSSYGIAPGDKLLLFVGRIAEEKRVIELMSICENIVSRRNDCKAMFVGKGPAIERLRRETSENGLTDKIIFTGYVEWDTVHRFYELSDIFITASMSEMHSMTILEAALSAMPIVARHDESYLDAVISGFNGFLAEDDAQMETYIDELLNDDQKRAEFGKRSAEVASRFSIESHIAATETLYKMVIGAYPKAVNEQACVEAVQAAAEKAFR